MISKKKSILCLLACGIAAVLFLRVAAVYAPSEGTIILESNAGVSLEEPLSDEELVTVKKILWGKIKWPESLYGIPACGFAKSYSLMIDGTRYMMAMDSCGTRCVEEADTFCYINISDSQKNALQEMFTSRGK